MPILEISKTLSINANHIDTIQAVQVDGVTHSIIRLQNRSQHTVRGDWKKAWLDLLKSGAVSSNGKTLEYRR